MPPVAAFIATVVSTISAVVTAISAWTVAGIAVGRILLAVGLNLLFSALFAPKNARVGQRQASILNLALGETPRRFAFGAGATGGALVNCWNDGTTNGNETQVHRIADHEIDSIVGFIIDDRVYSLTTQGAQTHADFKDDKGSRLSIWFRTGALGQNNQPIIDAHGTVTTEAGEPPQWTPAELAQSFKGIAYVVVRYTVSETVWKNGRPKFTWLYRGAKLYDPRLDSTVAGGSGPQRWGQPETYTYSENAYVAYYNYMRGVWNYAADPPQLMVGPGRSAEEMPPADAIAHANLCDELVTLKAGGTEKRYTVAGLVEANERWIDVEEHFAAAMGGQLVERAGSISVDPGVAKSVEFTFTDDDLRRGADFSFQAKVPRDKLVNTVIARYVSPAQLYQEASAPMRRSLEDIEADGEAREQTIDLVLVTSGTQAQRCAEIIRRKARLQTTAAVPLGPRYMLVEDGDWGEWTSARRFAGETRTFEAQGYADDGAGNCVIPLKEIGTTVFAWNPAVDELDVSAPYLPPGAPAPAEVEDFDAEAVEISSGDGVSAGGIRATWTPSDDTTIIAIRLEYRPVGGLALTQQEVSPSTGEYVISGLAVVDVDYEIRATPILSPKRDALTTAFRTVSLSVPFTTPEPPNGFTGYQSGDLIRFVWVQFADPTLQYEIRAGDTFDLGRYVTRVSGGSVTVPWPISSDDDDVLFWIKTRHRSGLYSEQASLWRATPNVINPNYVLSEDYQDEEFPGVVHKFSNTVIGDDVVLELDQVDGITRTRGDYYATLELLDTFNARAWVEHRASAYVDDVPAWDETEETWDDFGDDDWQPTIGDPGGDASIEAFIATNITLPDSMIEAFTFNGSTTGAVDATTPAASSGITYAPARAANGVVVAGALSYDIDLPQTFSELFDRRLGTTPTDDLVIVELTDDAGGFLRFLWDFELQAFVLRGHFAPDCVFDIPWEADDTISVGLWQSETARGATVASKQNPEPITGSTLLV